MFIYAKLLLNFGSVKLNSHEQEFYLIEMFFKISLLYTVIEATFFMKC